MKNMMPMMILVIILLSTSFFFTWQGVQMQNQIQAQEDILHANQAKYFSINKAERESVPTNDPLTETLVDIQQAPSELLQLKLVGVGKILTGIFFMLFLIAIFLFMMPIRLGQLMQNKPDTNEINRS